MKYTAIDPEHYRKFPQGIGDECIKFVRLLPFSQGNAGKYLYRAGNKGYLKQDLKKALWYVNDALESSNSYSLSEEFLQLVNPASTTRSRLFFLLISNNLLTLKNEIEEIIEKDLSIE